MIGAHPGVPAASIPSSTLRRRRRRSSSAALLNGPHPTTTTGGRIARANGIGARDDEKRQSDYETGSPRFFEAPGRQRRAGDGSSGPDDHHTEGAGSRGRPADRG